MINTLKVFNILREAFNEEQAKLLTEVLREAIEAKKNIVAITPILFPPIKE